MAGPTVRLTELAHGGGCGCKLAGRPAGRAGRPTSGGPLGQLLVGAETSDGAAVWQVDENLAVMATTDFFMPMVDDPRDFGRIAAATVISDIYAMGGRPIMALAILGMPVNKLAPDVIRQIRQDGASICAEAGMPVAGGHSIDAPEPIYGLAIIGLCRPNQVRRNTNVQAGDALILAKGLGVGIYSAAIKQQALPEGAYAEMIPSTTLLNRVKTELATDPAVHRITDVTGFGLLGHALEMASGLGLCLTLWQDVVPLLRHATVLAQQGFVTGASHRN